MAQGRSSDQLVDVLLAQIAGVDVSQITEGDTFEGQVGMCECVCVCVHVGGEGVHACMLVYQARPSLIH